MRTLLIAEPSEIYAAALIEKLRGDYSIIHCQDGDTALEILSEKRPDILILNMSLPFKDGLTLLQEMPYKPSVIVGMISTQIPYIMTRGCELGADEILIMPKPSTVSLRITDLVQWKCESTKETVEHNVDMLLHLLQIPSHRCGYNLLRMIVPMYHENPAQSLSKNLYPAVAQACNFLSASAVDQNIRRTIKAAWAIKDSATWSKYFDIARKAPTNLEFISRLALELDSYNRNR